MLWMLYVVLSALMSALMVILDRFGIRGLDPILALTIQMLIVNLFLVAICVVTLFYKGFDARTIIQPFFSVQGMSTVAAGIAGGVSWIFYIFVLKYGPKTSVAFIPDQLSLVLTPLLASFFLREPLTALYIPSAIFIILGSWLTCL
ncbi:MAG: EamA family transporter [Hydrogenophaga sp.]|nr:EamA family transporter [Hydrogenophaga sp.]